MITVLFLKNTYVHPTHSTTWGRLFHACYRVNESQDKTLHWLDTLEFSFLGNNAVPVRNVTESSGISKRETAVLILGVPGSIPPRQLPPKYAARSAQVLQSPAHSTIRATLMWDRSIICLQKVKHNNKGTIWLCVFFNDMFILKKFTVEFPTPHFIHTNLRGRFRRDIATDLRFFSKSYGWVGI